MQYRNKNPVAQGRRGKTVRFLRSLLVIGLDEFLCVSPPFAMLSILDTRSHVRFDAHACTHNSRCVTLNPSSSRSMRTRGKTNAFCRPRISIRAFARVYIISWRNYCTLRVDIDVKIFDNQFLFRYKLE